MDEEKFKITHLGEWSPPECSVVDSKGNHCPDKPIHFFKRNEKDVGLCERCYKIYEMGYYDHLMPTPKQLRYNEWLMVVDAWRLKFKHPLTRQQAIAVLRDEREFKDGEFTSPKMSDITCWKEYPEFIEIEIN